MRLFHSTVPIPCQFCLFYTPPVSSCYCSYHCYYPLDRQRQYAGPPVLPAAIPLAGPNNRTFERAAVLRGRVCMSSLYGRPWTEITKSTPPLSSQLSLNIELTTRIPPPKHLNIRKIYIYINIYRIQSKDLRTRAHKRTHAHSQARACGTRKRRDFVSFVLLFFSHIKNKNNNEKRPPFI